MNAPKLAPGPWTVEFNSGHNGWRRGFYVYRMRPDWGDSAVEWMKDGRRRIAYFLTRGLARAALAKAVQS